MRSSLSHISAVWLQPEGGPALPLRLLWNPLAAHILKPTRARTPRCLLTWGITRMDGKGLLTVAGRFAVVILGIGVLGWVWMQSESPERPPTTKALVGQLQAGDAGDRRTAVQELSKTSAEDATAVLPALVAALNDREASVRGEAALALGHCLEVALKLRGAGLTDQARAAITSLLAVLKRDDDLNVRASVAFAVADLLRELRNAGIKPDQANSDDPIDPRMVAQAFNAALKRDPAARLVVLPPYQKLGPFEEGAPAVLVAALDDPSRVVRIQALLVISQFSSGVDQAVAVLLKEAEFKDPRHSAERVPDQSSGSPGSREPASHGGRYSDADQGIEKPECRREQCGCRASGAPWFRGAIGRAALVAAARAIIHSSPGPAKPSEQRLFSDLASTIVHVLPAEESVAILREALSPGHEATQVEATRALGGLRFRGLVAVPCLLHALQDAGKPASGPVKPEYAYAAIASLREIAVEAPLSKAMVDDVIEAVSRSLDHPQDWVRSEAANALGAFAHRASAALPRLRALSESAKEPLLVRRAAARAIEEIEAKPRRS